MKITDRPGRAFALTVMSPTLFYIGNNIHNEYLIESNILYLFSVGLFLYELFWISKTKCEFIE